MKEMVKTLAPSDWPAAIAYIGTLKARPTEKVLAGDLQRGHTLYASCVPCHGSRGEGNAAVDAPELSILEDWYVVRQLNNFIAGRRGAKPEDKPGTQMRAASQVLRNAQDITDVASYIAAMGSEATGR
jgi:cytochrome c553